MMSLRQRRSSSPQHDNTSSLIQLLNVLLFSAFNQVTIEQHDKPIRASINLISLAADASIGEPLWPAQHRRARLSKAVDAINRKIGKDAVWFGSVHDGVNDARLAAPTRISFTQIPDLNLDF
jgi:hypothetical protein